MNDKQIRRLFADIGEIRKRVSDLEMEKDPKEDLSLLMQDKLKKAYGEEIKRLSDQMTSSFVESFKKLSGLFPRNQFPWSSFERDFVAEKLNALIQEISLKIGRDESQIKGCLINNLDKRCPFGYRFGIDTAKMTNCLRCNIGRECSSYGRG